MRRSPKSPASASNRPPPDAFTLALALLGRRELSEAQLRARLARRGCPPDAIDSAIERLRKDHTLDDGRVARTAARVEATVRRRGPARVRQRLHALGLSSDVVEQAMEEAFADVDERALLDAALDRRLRGRQLADLDEKARARLMRGLIGQGFSVAEVLRRIRRS